MVKAGEFTGVGNINSDDYCIFLGVELMGLLVVVVVVVVSGGDGDGGVDNGMNCDALLSTSVLLVIKWCCVKPLKDWCVGVVMVSRCCQW